MGDAELETSIARVFCKEMTDEWHLGQAYWRSVARKIMEIARFTDAARLQESERLRDTSQVMYNEMLRLRRRCGNLENLVGDLRQQVRGLESELSLVNSERARD